MSSHIGTGTATATGTGTETRKRKKSNSIENKRKRQKQNQKTLVYTTTEMSIPSFTSIDGLGSMEPSGNLTTLINQTQNIIKKIESNATNTKNEKEDNEPQVEKERREILELVKEIDETMGYSRTVPFSGAYGNKELLSQFAGLRSSLGDKKPGPQMERLWMSEPNMEYCWICGMQIKKKTGETKKDFFIREADHCLPSILGWSFFDYEKNQSEEISLKLIALNLLPSHRYCNQIKRQKIFVTWDKNPGPSSKLSVNSERISSLLSELLIGSNTKSDSTSKSIFSGKHSANTTFRNNITGLYNDLDEEESFTYWIKSRFYAITLHIHGLCMIVNSLNNNSPYSLWFDRMTQRNEPKKLDYTYFLISAAAQKGIDYYFNHFSIKTEYSNLLVKSITDVSIYGTLKQQLGALVAKRNVTRINGRGTIIREKKINLSLAQKGITFSDLQTIRIAHNKKAKEAAEKAAKEAARQTRELTQGKQLVYNK